MENRLFGKTSLRVSVVGFGAWGIGGPAMAGSTPIGWGTVDDETSIRALETAFERGITFYDTADFYGLGHSEDLIGKTFGSRPNVVIATKVGHRLNNDGTIALDYSRQHIITACERSLKRLRRDWIDYYQLHSARVEHLEQGECIEAMENLKANGKIRFWGLSLNTFHPEPEADALMAMGAGDGFQLVLNIINQRAVPLLAQAAAKGYGIIARMPLQFGLLSGKFSRTTSFSPDDHRAFRLTPAILEQSLPALETIWPVADRLRITKACLALSYCASIPEVSTVISGIKTPEQAIENSGPLLQLSDADRSLLRSFVERAGAEILALMETQG